MTNFAPKRNTNTVISRNVHKPTVQSALNIFNCMHFIALPTTVVRIYTIRISLHSNRIICLFRHKHNAHISHSVIIIVYERPNRVVDYNQRQTANRNDTDSAVFYRVHAMALYCTHAGSDS